jgi:hypothetical protein
MCRKYEKLTFPYDILDTFLKSVCIFQIGDRKILDSWGILSFPEIKPMYKLSKYEN